jgi:hypothetical protein
MKLNKLKKAIPACLLLISIQGCSLYPDGTINPVEEGTMQVAEESPGHIQGELNGSVAIDADIIIPENAEWKQYEATERTFTKEEFQKAEKLFAFDSNIKAEYDYTDKSGVYRCEYDDDSSFTMNVGGIHYYTQDAEKRNYNMYISGTKTMSKESVFPVDELEDFSKEEAVNTVRMLCKELGVDLSEDEPEVYTMDAEHMTEIMMMSDNLHYYRTKDQWVNGEQGEEISWTKEDEVYYMIFSINLDGNKLTDRDITTDSYYGAGSTINAVIGKNGLKLMSVGSGYLFDIVEASELDGNICSYEEALDVLASAYQYLDGYTEITLEKMELVYVPVGKGENNVDRKYTVRPYWQCTMKMKGSSTKNGETTEYTDEVVSLIDAVSKTIYKGKRST